MAARKVLSAGLYSSRVGFQSATVGGAVWLNSRMLTTLSGVKPFSEIPSMFVSSVTVRAVNR